MEGAFCRFESKGMQGMYCAKCGNQLPDDALFCTKCGTKINIGDQHNRNTSNMNGMHGRKLDQKAKLSRILIGVGIGAVAALVLVVGIIVAGDILRGAALRRESKQYSYGYGQDNGVSQAEVSMENDSGKTTTETAEKAYEETMSGDGTSDNNLQGITFEPSARVLNPDSEYPIVQIDDIVIPLDATYSVADLFDAMDNSVLGDDLWLRKPNGERLKRNSTVINPDQAYGWDLMYKDELVGEIFGSAQQKDYYSTNEIFIEMVNSPVIIQHSPSDRLSKFVSQNPTIEHVLFWRNYRSSEPKTIETLSMEMDALEMSHKLDYNGGTMSCGNATFVREGESSYTLLSVIGLNRNVAISRGIL